MNSVNADFNVTNAIADLFKIKGKITGQRGSNDTKNLKIMLPFKHLSNFWRTLEMALINCEINLDLNSSKNNFIVANNTDQNTTFSVTDTKIYILVVSLSTQDNAKNFE